MMLRTLSGPSHRACKLVSRSWPRSADGVLRPLGRAVGAASPAQLHSYQRAWRTAATHPPPSLGCRHGAHRQSLLGGSAGRPFVSTSRRWAEAGAGKQGQNNDGGAVQRPHTKNPLARENIYTLPNLLTLSRLLAAPAIGYCIMHDAHAWALGLFVAAGVTDVLDGWIARRWRGQQTVMGSVIDPMADKALMAVVVVSLAARGSLPAWLAVVILGRDVALGVAAVYYRWISLPPPKTMARYWDFALPSAEVRPTTVSKYNTFLQLALMGLTITAPVVPWDLSMALTVMQYVVATTTVWSGASYVFSKDAVKILSKPKAKDA